MISYEQYAQIRKACLDGLSQRAAAKILRLSRDTVRRYWDGSKLPDEMEKRFQEDAENPSLQREIKHEAIRRIHEFYELNKDRVGKKQKITAKMVTEYVNLFVSVSYPTVCRILNEIDMGGQPEPYLPLVFEPGETMQVDWCDATVIINDKKVTVHLFCAVMAFSGKIFSMPFQNMTYEDFCMGHVEAFRYFGGITTNIFYDNLATAVLRGTWGKNAVTHKRFNLLKAHYGFEPIFMNRASGNEKGIVENLCQHIRTIAYTPMPKGSNLMEIQEKSLLKFDDHNKNHQIKGKSGSILELSEIESKHLLPLPAKHFNPYAEKICAVDKFSTFTHDTCHYSVPVKYVGKKVSLTFTPYEIHCWSEGQKIATHMRSLYKGKKFYELEHYLDILAKKKAAQNNAAPAKEGKTFPELETFREKCKEPNNAEQTVKLAFLCKEKGQDIVLDAVDQANKNGLPTFEKVVTILKIMSLDHYNDTSLNNDEKNELNFKVEFDSIDEYDRLIYGCIDDDKNEDETNS
jgi:transposase